MEKETRKPDGDLKCAFECNPQEGLSISDIKHMHAAVFGENDGADWHWIAELNNGKFAYITGGCDYTGWDCQSSASHEIFDTLKEAVNAVPEKEEYYNRGNLREHIEKQIEGKEHYGVIVIPN